MTPRSEKLVITNFTVLRSKYGASGLTRLRAALDKLVAADAGRGLVTTVVDVSSAQSMKSVGAAAVTEAGDPRANKQAVDAVYHASVPDYLLLLGGPDVIPHIDLKNPVYGPRGDGDRLAPGDLPYACEAPYSQNVRDFVGPTRVLGRVPDLPGAKEPGLLLALLAVAANWKQRAPSEYANYLAISAAVWQKSTTLSVQRIFGAAARPHLSPPEGPQWTPEQLGALAHFINCHGAPADPAYYGQADLDYPRAHEAAWVAGKITEGTVATAECCYGAELYDPQLVPGLQAGIAVTYLASRAYGFLGSTTIAYGPADSNGAADLLCQYFLRRAISGPSLGRAALEARQEFAQGAAELDPCDLKTLAQFNLLADPSICPVEKATLQVATTAKSLSPAAASQASVAVARADRRRQLTLRGLAISQSVPVAKLDKKLVPSPQVQQAVRELARQAGVPEADLLSYSLTAPAAARSVTAKGLLGLARNMAAPSAFHVLAGKRDEGPGGAAQIVAIVAREQDGRIISSRQLVSR